MPVGLVDLSSTTVHGIRPSIPNLGTSTRRVLQPTIWSSTATRPVARSFSGPARCSGHGACPISTMRARTAICSTPDPNVQQAMVNLFADMGVQPQTLQASLVIASQSTDHTPPTSRISSVSIHQPSSKEQVGDRHRDCDGRRRRDWRRQISTDGGKTWHPASGQSARILRTGATLSTRRRRGHTTIESRAVDDSLNLETPGPACLHRFAVLGSEPL